MFQVVAIAALVVLVSAGDNMPPEKKAAMDICQKQFPKVTEAVIKEMCTPTFTTTDADTKCFMKCLGETLGTMDSKGKINKEVALKMNHPAIDQEKLKANIDSCIALAGDSDCETAYQQWMCLHTKAAKSA